MGMSLKNQETESLQDSKGKNNREKLAQERFSLDTSNFFFPRRTVRQRHMLLRDTSSFQVPTNKMKPWEAWPQSWLCCGQEIGPEIAWGPLQPLIFCFPHSHSHRAISDIPCYTQILLLLWCYRDTTDRLPKYLLFYQFKSYPILNILCNVSQETSLALGWNEIIPSLISLLPSPKSLHHEIWP